MAKHEFALYYANTSSLEVNSTVIIDEPAVVRRVVQVLRLQVDAKCILFDSAKYAYCRLASVAKRSITVFVLSVHANHALKPEVVWFLPILEREAFDQAVSALTVMGISRIVPLITEKSRKKWGTEKDRARLQRVMIAAAEQSKQFVIPVVDDVQSLRTHTFAQYADSPCLYFDPHGESAFSCVSSLREQKPKRLYAMVGPEGDLTPAEKVIIERAQFTFCTLTPTVLRAVDAVRVGSGMLRSLL